MMSLRVVYICPDILLGYEMFTFLKTLPCKIVEITTEDREIDWSIVPPFDLGINFLGTRKIPSEQVQNNKFLNFHPAPLPEFKGRNLAYHAIVNGAKEFGATLHWMAEDYDTGPLIEVKRFSIEDHHTSGDLVRISHQLLRELFLKWVPKILNGEEVPSTPQNKEAGCYYKKTSLCEEIYIPDSSRVVIRALTCHPKHHSQITISGKKYKIIPCEE